MVKEVIVTPHPSQYPFSRGIKTEQLIFVAGTTGYQNLDTGEKINGIQAQARKALDNIKEVLKLGGSSLDDVVNATVYLRNPGDFQAMNEIFRKYFPKDPPARATLVTGFVNPDVLIEIQCIACRH